MSNTAVTTDNIGETGLDHNSSLLGNKQPEEPQNNDQTPVKNDDNVQDGFVLIEADDSVTYEKHRVSFFTQMETILVQQVEKCDHYRKQFEQQNNTTMSNKFATYSLNTVRNLELLRMSWKNNEVLPRYKFEYLNFNCLPINVGVQEKELQITVKASSLPISPGASTYIIAEFAFPHSKDETITSSFRRWLHYVTIDPKNIVSPCREVETSQFDLVYSNNIIPFTKPDSEYIHYSRPIVFFIEKGKSRTLRRKFKPVKLTFYEKTSFLSFNKRIGSVQIKIDGINDDITFSTKQNIMDGRKHTEAVADIKIKVREALVNKSVRAHEEKLLLLT